MSPNSDRVNADSISRAYVRLALHIERQQPGFVDAYFGPAEWKAEADAEGKLPPDRLRADAEALLAEIGRLPGSDELRREWLTKQVIAMIATVRRLQGEAISFDDELRLVYDIQPGWTDESQFEAALRTMDELLPGSGELADRMEAWNARFEVLPERLLPLLAMSRDEAQRRTRQLFRLPEGEEVELQIVKGQPWSGYNWYLGDYRSRVEVNTDMPVRANQMLSLMTHEGYPGHHTEHAIKEEHLYRKMGYAEASVQLINAPECVISEGIADLAREIIFTEDELEAWLRDEFLPAAGLTGIDIKKERALVQAQRNLRSLDGNAAFMLFRDGADEEEVVRYMRRYSARTEQRARRSYNFVSLNRGYIFTYHFGRDLLYKYTQAGDRIERFRTLLEEPLTPSRVQEWIAGSRNNET